MIKVRALITTVIDFDSVAQFKDYCAKMAESGKLDFGKLLVESFDTGENIPVTTEQPALGVSCTTRTSVEAIP